VQAHKHLFCRSDLRRRPISHSNAVIGLLRLSPRNRNPVGSWKGWTWVSHLERLTNGYRDLLGRPIPIAASSAAMQSPELVHAIAGEISVDEEGSLPTDIQWAPPGQHTIEASQGGKAVRRIVKVTAETAANVQKDFQEIQSKADAGEEDRVYIDLNHSDEEAAAHVTGFHWGGDHPLNGGVRANVEWTAAGANAVKGKTYRRFSPSFFLDENGSMRLKHQASGLYAVNSGGLVNRAAFKRIAPIWSKSAEAGGGPEEPITTKENDRMKSLLAVLAKQGLISSADVDEPSAVAQVTAKLSELTTARSSAETEVTQLKAKLQTTEQQRDKALDAHATAVVDAAIAAGRIPGQDDKVKAKWVGLIKADPTNASLLPEPNPALQTIVAKGKPGDGVHQGSTHPFMAKVAEYQATHKCSEAFAIEAVAHTADGNKLYNDYRKDQYGVKAAA
jgi:phage I-like protein